MHLHLPQLLVFAFVFFFMFQLLFTHAKAHGKKKSRHHQSRTKAQKPALVFLVLFCFKVSVIKTSRSDSNLAKVEKTLSYWKSCFKQIVSVRKERVRSVAASFVAVHTVCILFWSLNQPFKSKKLRKVSKRDGLLFGLRPVYSRERKNTRALQVPKFLF